MTQTKVEAPFVENNNNFKNLIMNGAMQIWQRSTSAVTTTGDYVTVDRWKISEDTDGSISSEQSALSVADQATTGCQNALLVKCTGTDGTIGASQSSELITHMEAQLLPPDLGYGTSSAKSLTLSFWVYAYAAGTYCISLKKDDSAGDLTAYSYTKEYTVDASNTWEKKTITISPTAGSTSLITSAAAGITRDNGVGLRLNFALAMGSNYHGSDNTWTSSTALSTSNQANFLSSTSNTFYLTGVQLEVGEAATALEQVPFDVNLARCQRYFYKESLYTGGGATGHVGCGQCNTTTRCDIPIRFPVFMRAIPTFSDSSADDFRLQHGGTLTVLSNLTGEGDGVVPYVSSSMLYCTVSSGLTAGNAANLIHNNTAATFQFDAEL